MRPNNRTAPEILQPAVIGENLPEFMNVEALNLYYGSLPTYVNKMPTKDLIARANDIKHEDGILSTWERGEVHNLTGKVVYGSLEPHAVNFARLRNPRSPDEHDELVKEGFYDYVLPLVDKRVQQEIQATLRKRIIDTSASHEPDAVFNEFLSYLADYDPKNLEPARKLSEEVFVHYLNLKPKRVAPYVQERTFDAFAAISKNSQRPECLIPGKSSGIPVTVNLAKVGMLFEEHSRAVLAAGSHGRTPDLDKIKAKFDPLFDKLGYKAPEMNKTVVPTTARFVVGAAKDSVLTMGRVSEDAARRAKAVADVAPQKVFSAATVGVIGVGSFVGIPSAHAATPQSAEQITSLVVPEINTLDLTVKVETPAALSAVPAAFVEAAPARQESQESISNKALRSEIERLVKQSRAAGGMWAKWETVDPDVLYNAIIREEKRNPHSVVNRFLVLPQLKNESFLKINAVSGVGARGLTQFMPGTWQTWGHGKSAFDPDAAVRAQFEYDIALYNQAHKRFPRMNETQLTRLMLAGYNAGPNNKYVKHGNVPPKYFANGQTYNYVRDITAAMESMKDRLPSNHVSAAPKAVVPKVIAKVESLFDPSASFFGMLNGNVAEGDTSPIQLGGPAEVSEEELSPMVLNSLLGRLSIESGDIFAPQTVGSETNAADMLQGDSVYSAVPEVLLSPSFIANINSTPDTHIETPPVEALAPPVDLGSVGTPAPQVVMSPYGVTLEQPEIVNTPPSNTVIAPPTTSTPDVITTPPSVVQQPTTMDLMEAFAALDNAAKTPQITPIPLDLTPTEVAGKPPVAIDIPLITTPEVSNGSNGLEILPPAITEKVEPPKVEEKLKPVTPAQPAPKKAETSKNTDVNKEQVKRLKGSGNFRGSQALSDRDDKAPRAPLIAKIRNNGEKNGKLSNDDLERVGKYWGDAQLHPAAAASFRDMDAAFHKKFGHHIQFTGPRSDYRDLDAQKEIYNEARPGFAATPKLHGPGEADDEGTSNHGWGVAGDLVLTNAEEKWMLSEAINFGWVHPYFARKGGPTPERWHYEFWGLNWS